MSVEGAVLDRLSACGAATRVTGPIALDPVPALPALSVLAEQAPLAGGFAEASVRLTVVGQGPGAIDTVRESIRTLLNGESWTADGTTIVGAVWRNRGELSAVADLGLTAAEDEWMMVVEI